MYKRCACFMIVKDRLFASSNSKLQININGILIRNRYIYIYNMDFAMKVQLCIFDDYKI